MKAKKVFPQKAQLVTEIINHALTLVQDPFGNYVVQYVLDLGDAHFSDLLIRRFIGHVGSLSVQKFSSNVMEKVAFWLPPATMTVANSSVSASVSLKLTHDDTLLRKWPTVPGLKNCCGTRTPITLCKLHWIMLSLLSAER